MSRATGTTFRKATWLALLVCLSSVVYASGNAIDCDEAADPLTVDTFDEISAADAAAQENAATPSAASEENAVRAALPGVSEGDSRLYSREMYRTDI